ncbi:MAG: hypothetical protein IJD21_01830 [Oscillospiraceae bacterium]|nr:hypothetical protein [Oscillospiraceae bacterium]
MEQKNDLLAEILFFLSLVAAALGALLGMFSWLGRLPIIRSFSFARPKEPIRRSFQRGEDELRRE